ncbi:MAG: hypothetical protein NWQ28_05850 [Nodularia sp. (in: cyanobacteria)]|nr:hypothetical protein [Nodularia sp. (in: cyanobacteria)]
MGFLRLEVIYPSDYEAVCLSDPADIFIKTATDKFCLPNCHNVKQRWGVGSGLKAE